MTTEREQKLVDITFQVSLMIHKNESFAEMNAEELTGWVALQLEMCGFPTKPVGSSWGKLK